MARRTKSEIMANVECIKSSIIANNTVEYHRKSGERVIRLHLTDIITFKPDGSIVLDSGGWQTVTTKERMNRAPEIQVYQEKSVWYVAWHGATHVYQDGITLYPDGSVTGQGSEETGKALKKQIKEYVDGFMTALVNRELEPPSGGDCWDCSFKTESGQTMGELSRSEHILSHFEEKYYVPTLLCNAMEELGTSKAAKHCVGFWLGMHDQEADFWEDIAKQQTKSALTRYLKRQVGLAR